MFILVFLVMFDVKKGSIIAYKSVWHFNPIENFYSLFKLFKTKYISKNSTVNLTYSSLFKFSFTSVTSRSTSYMLFSFWVFFFFFGESLLLVVFNYGTPIDTITSSSFFTIKQHTVFLLNTNSSKLLSHINFYILLMTSLSFTYLVNLCYSYNYSYFKHYTINLFMSTIFIIIFFIV
jgi:hypothetical protein